MRRLIDKPNMRLPSGFGNVASGMTAMRPMQGWVSLFDPFREVRTSIGLRRYAQIIRPCSRGEQGQSLRNAEAFHKETRGGRGGRGCPTASPAV